MKGEVLVGIKTVDYYTLSMIQNGISTWPAWKGMIIGGDPILNGWETATLAIQALKDCGYACSYFGCQTCWTKYSDLLALYKKENPDVEGTVNPVA